MILRNGTITADLIFFLLFRVICIDHKNTNTFLAQLGTESAGLTKALDQIIGQIK
jgi:hypothetical protein